MTSLWFKHDDDAAMDEKLIELRMLHGPAGYGVWWMIVEYMHKHEGTIESVERFAYTFNVEVAFAKQVLESLHQSGLLQANKDRTIFYSNRVKNQLEQREDVKHKRSESGKIGGLTKAKVVASAKQLPSKILAEKSREEEIREESPVEKSTVTTKTKRERASDEDTEQQFFKMIVANSWCDQPYADSKQKQFKELRGENRSAALKKMRVAINSWRSPSERTKQLAKKIYHETSGLIQDRALDASTLSSKVLADRRAFSMAESGQVVE